MSELPDGENPTATDEEGASEVSEVKTWIIFGRSVQRRAVALVVTLLVTSLTCLGLAVCDFGYAESVPDKFVSTVWLVAGLSGAVALVHLLLDKSWIGLCYIHFALCCLLALQVMLADWKSEIHEWATLGIPALVILVSVVWMYRLWKYIPKSHLTRMGKVTTAVLGTTAAIVSLLTFWWTNEYLPRTTLPKVDLSAELVEVSRTGTIVHLAAKITIENKGSLSVQPYASLMRITAYPAGTQPLAPTPEHIAGGMDFDYPPSRDFRSVPLDFEHRTLLYSDDFMGFTAMLAPGASVSYQRIIDVDAKVYARARLNVTASFFNRRSADVAETCGEKPVFSDQTDIWQEAVSAPIVQEVSKPTPLGETPELKTLCYDRHLLPRSAIDKLVSDQPRIRSIYVLESPCAYRAGVGNEPPKLDEGDPALSCPIEVPYVYTDWTSAKTWSTYSDTRKFDDAYPNITLPRTVELVLSESPAADIAKTDK